MQRSQQHAAVRRSAAADAERGAPVCRAEPGHRNAAAAVQQHPAVGGATRLAERGPYACAGGSHDCAGSHGSGRPSHNASTRSIGQQGVCCHLAAAQPTGSAGALLGRQRQPDSPFGRRATAGPAVPPVRLLDGSCSAAPHLVAAFGQSMPD